MPACIRVYMFRKNSSRYSHRGFDRHCYTRPYLYHIVHLSGSSLEHSELSITVSINVMTKTLQATSRLSCSQEAPETYILLCFSAHNLHLFCFFATDNINIKF